MLRLDDLIGHSLILALRESEESHYTVTLHGVEMGGIWIEGAEIGKLASFLVPKQVKGQPRHKPVFFVPYAQVSFLVSMSPELNEQ